jgi:hypothetical protein
MKKALIIAFGSVMTGWLLYLTAGSSLARALAVRFEGAVLRIGEGKIVSVLDFIQHRLFEALWLATLLAVWTSLHVLLAGWQRSRDARRRWRWAWHSVLAFLCLNLWLSQAERCVLFWGTMWQGHDTQNLTRFYIKLFLARENPAPMRVALMGSSQTRAQIDEELLNAILAPRVRTTELHYPGSKAYDHFVMQPIIARIRPRYIICYVSEADFHSGSASEVAPNFFTFADLRDLIRLGGTKFVPKRGIGYGLLGSVLPIFRLREVLTQRIFGPQIAQMEQRRYDLALDTDLRERVRRAAATYQMNEEMEFQRRAFREFVRRCELSQERVIILCGQLNPLFGDAIDPRLRQDMISFLRSLAREHTNISIVENLPPQGIEDYEDLTHVSKAGQERFTRFLADWLRREWEQPRQESR